MFKKLTIMEYIIRKTAKDKYYQTENLTRETFWNLYNPGCSEHFILHNLRKSISYIEELDLIAEYKGEIIGHIISTRAQVVDHQNLEHEVLCVGPFAVSPNYQNLGIGKKLLNYSIFKAQVMKFKGMILFGNPDYYHRFGFKNAEIHKITTKDGQNFDAFMALELDLDSLLKVEGRFVEDKAFTVSDTNLLEFDKLFPVKEKGTPKIKVQ